MASYMNPLRLATGLKRRFILLTHKLLRFDGRNPYLRPIFYAISRKFVRYLVPSARSLALRRRRRENFEPCVHFSLVKQHPGPSILTLRRCSGGGGVPPQHERFGAGGSRPPPEMIHHLAGGVPGRRKDRVLERCSTCTDLRGCRTAVALHAHCMSLSPVWLQHLSGQCMWAVQHAGGAVCMLAL